MADTTAGKSRSTRGKADADQVSLGKRGPSDESADNPSKKAKVKSVNGANANEPAQTEDDNQTSSSTASETAPSPKLKKTDMARADVGYTYNDLGYLPKAFVGRLQSGGRRVDNEKSNFHVVDIPLPLIKWPTTNSTQATVNGKPLVICAMVRLLGGYFSVKKRANEDTEDEDEPQCPSRIWMRFYPTRGKDREMLEKVLHSTARPPTSPKRKSIFASHLCMSGGKLKPFAEVYEAPLTIGVKGNEQIALTDLRPNDILFVELLLTRYCKKNDRTYQRTNFTTWQTNYSLLRVFRMLRAPWDAPNIEDSGDERSKVEVDDDD